VAIIAIVTMANPICGLYARKTAKLWVHKHVILPSSSTDQTSEKAVSQQISDDSDEDIDKHAAKYTRLRKGFLMGNGYDENCCKIC
jgi:hypothetical protein